MQALRGYAVLLKQRLDAAAKFGVLQVVRADIHAKAELRVRWPTSLMRVSPVEKPRVSLMVFKRARSSSIRLLEGACRLTSGWSKNVRLGSSVKESKKASFSISTSRAAMAAAMVASRRAT